VSRVAWLHTLDDRDRDRAGGKAFVLGRLRRAGLPVPDGFVLAAGAAVDDPSWHADLMAAYHELGGAVAVRSSSVVEDGAHASFAGQFTTVLDVEGATAVVEAARACLRSAAGGAAYARAMGEDAGAPLAVLVQRFVPARVSGVVFTRDPRGADGLVVEAHAGRGDALVGGRVTPERFRLERATGRLLERSGAAGAIDPPTLQAVVALALAAERLLGGAQDVEWALADEGPVVLQSRPITVAADEPRDPRIRRLTRANVGEVLPGAVTPLTWSTIGFFLEQGFEAVADAAGVRALGAPPFLVLYRRRLYLNLDLALDVATRLPGVGAPEAERLVLGGGAARAPAPGPARATRVSRRARAVVLARTWRLSTSLPRAIERAEREVQALPPRGAAADASGAEVARRLEAVVALGKDVSRTHIAVSGSSAVRLALLARWLGRRAGGDPVERVNRLVAAIDEVESASPALALETIAAEAARRPPWRLWLLRPPEETAWEIPSAPDGLSRLLADFLARYGHRAVSEGELQARSWAEDPAPILGALQGLLHAGERPELRRRCRAEMRAAEEQALLSAAGPGARLLVRLLLGKAREGVRERERTKSLAIALVDRSRALVRAGARELVRAGTLRAEDDVFFLTRDELQAALGGAPVPLGVVARRRRVHEREAALSAPRDVELDQSGAEVGAGTEEAAAAGPLRGLGVSPGVGVGKARVLTAGEMDGLAPGEVLVAPVLDAALGPVLVSAAAAVVEVGGLLSHGAVVARELGVPCVVDVRDATRRIRTGDRLRVDGGRGEVTPLGDEDAERADAPAVAEASRADEAFHVLAADARARESVYFNAQDPRRGFSLVASAGVRHGGRGEALAALGLPDGRVLFRLDRGPARFGPRSLTVGATTVSWDPPGLTLDGDFAPHEAAAFPPGPLPLLLSPRTVAVRAHLTFSAGTPAVDFTRGLPDDVRAALAELGSNHVEQSGEWRGTVGVDGHTGPFDGTGSRDHSWGLRDWDAADYWRLFTLRLPGLALHALLVSARGRLVQGGFVWKDGVAQAVTRVEYAARREQGRVRELDVEVWTAADRLRLRGIVQRTLVVPVQLDRRPWRHLAGRPYRLLLHENFTRYEAGGQEGYGMAEFTDRP
jgi:pyruvate,water dikinase